MGRFFQRKGVRAARKVFRWCRMLVWIVLLVVVGELAYLHLVGLPDFLKRPLLAKIRDRGFQAQFTNARLSWGPSVVIENASFSGTNKSGARLSAGTTEIQLNWDALLHGRLKMDSVEIVRGSALVPVARRYGKTLSLGNVYIKMNVASNDFARFVECTAWLRGMQIRVNGEVGDIWSLRNWKLPSRLRASTNHPPENPLESVTNILEQIHFAQNPRLDVHFFANGKDRNTLRGEAMFTARGMETPWGGSGLLEVRLTAAHLLDATNQPAMQVTADADRITTPWGSGRDISVVASFFPDPKMPLNAWLTVSANDLDANWHSKLGDTRLRAKSVSWDGKASLSTTNFKASAVEGILQVAGADSQWGSAGAFSLKLDARRTNAPAPPDPTWGAWTLVSPYVFSFSLAATNINSPKLQFGDLVLDATWQAPRLAIQKIGARLYHGRLDASAELNVASRETHCLAAADFDPHEVAQWMTPAGQRWVSQYTWSSPPAINADIRMVAPPWTNRPDDWRNAFRSSIQIAGDFRIGPASFRGIETTSANSPVFYTNRTWHLPRLHATRPDGELDLDYTGNEVTHEFDVRFESHLNPDDAMPFLNPAQQKLLLQSHFSTPPAVQGELSGSWRDRQSIAFTGTVAASNFTVRGESIDAFSGKIEYTNHLFTASNVRFVQGSGNLEIPLTSVDLVSNRIFLTNAQSTLDPGILDRQMGAKTPAFLKVVHFDTPPHVTASGSFVLGNPLATDMRFAVQGSNFHWTNLGADKITGNVLWVARDVALTNVTASLYDSGRLNGWLAFDYVPRHGSGFRSEFTVKNISLSLLGRSLSGKNTHVAGKLDGSLILTAPSSSNKQTWTGRGYVNVHDALLWQIKIFGIFSPVLNAIAPGAGDSRAKSATARFTIGNGEVASDNLEVQATAMRLLYRGDITMDKQVKGRVEADLLRNMPLVGGLLSLTLSPLSKIFEYEIKGPMDSPVIKPLYVPKFVMMLLRPFHTLKSILPEAPSDSPPKQAK
jgi:hypothetical protein